MPRYRIRPVTRSAAPSATTRWRDSRRHAAGEERLAAARSTARRMASAISTGFFAPAMPVFMSTAVQPSPARSPRPTAVPTPASTITGTPTFSMIEADVVRVADAQARADRRGQRHDREAAGVLELLAGDEVVRAVRQDLEALDQAARRPRPWPCCPGTASWDRRSTSSLTSSSMRSFAREVQGADRLRRRCSSRRCWAGAGTSCDRSRRGPSGPGLERSTRRRATVTISAPEAARRRGSRRVEAYLPVPTMMREAKRAVAQRPGVVRLVAVVV